MIYPYPKEEDINFRSDRGLPLITQNVLEFQFDDDRYKRVPILTMENHNKWYTMWVIHPDDTVTSLYEAKEEDYLNEDTWFDHCIIPKYFHNVARKLGYTYDSLTFALVCERFVADKLDDDWSRLAPYLPDTE